MLELEASATRGIHALGASLSGAFPSFFKGAPKPIREGSEEDLPDMPGSARAARIIVVGDVDFSTNYINVSQARHNMEFLLRAADWLVSADDIISIRNRQPKTGRFDRVSDPDIRSALMKFSQILNVGVIPLLVIVIGILFAMRRAGVMRGEQRYVKRETKNGKSADNIERIADNAEKKTEN